jgi:catechol 2,3-dioxygenase-like lactoylglutathione lyase family enzyme
MARLRHFAGCVKNLEKSAKFYSKVFDLNEVGREDIDIGWIRMGSYSIFHITAGSEPTAGDDWTAIPHRHSPRIAGNATCRIVALCRSVEIPLGARRTICPGHPPDAFGIFGAVQPYLGHVQPKPLCPFICRFLSPSQAVGGPSSEFLGGHI